MTPASVVSLKVDVFEIGQRGEPVQCETTTSIESTLINYQKLTRKTNRNRKGSPAATCLNNVSVSLASTASFQTADHHKGPTRSRGVQRLLYCLTSLTDSGCLITRKPQIRVTSASDSEASGYRPVHYFRLYYQMQTSSLLLHHEIQTSSLHLQSTAIGAYKHTATSDQFHKSNFLRLLTSQHPGRPTSHTDLCRLLWQANRLHETTL
ncbi:hypothetical protein Bbelb_174480 [Branchiostoma belcheri]|nr:hypothetical protein Bbelb_174480 [Branchiostoma belcheri]